MDFFSLLFKTILLRPYVFLFLAAFLFAARGLLGWKRTGLFMAITWATAFLCEFSSTRTGIPFGWYYYTGSTIHDELYIANVPFMDSLSFIFLLFASYCMALFFILPSPSRGSGRTHLPELIFDPVVRTSWPVLALAVLYFAFIDVIIDPVALRGDRWFLGQIYGYHDPGIHFGVPVANYVGWAIVGVLSLTAYFFLDRRLERTVAPPRTAQASNGMLTRCSAASWILLGCALYYGVLAFNLVVAFWIGEALIGMTGILIYLPITTLFLLRSLGRLPAPYDSGARSAGAG